MSNLKSQRFGTPVAMDFLSEDDQPQIYDHDMPDHNQPLFFEDAFAADTLYGEGDLENSLYQSPMQPKVEEPQEDDRRDSTDNAFYTSPESSTQDSSSDSSAKHGRKLSSRSSHSPNVKKVTPVAEAVRPGKWRGGPINRAQVSQPGDGVTAQVADLESSNRVMETAFDFDSAANTPSPFTSGNSPVSSIPGGRFVAIPQDSPIAPSAVMMKGQASHSVSMGSRDNSPLAPSMTSNSYSHVVRSARASPTNSEEFMDMTSLNSRMPPLAHGQQMQGVYGNQSTSSAQQPNMQSQSGLLDPTVVLGQRPTPSQLFVNVPVSKTRVETQTTVTLSLFPVPPGIKRLHLPTHTIAKSKLLARQPPTKEPEMLELSTMVVCTSAMQDPEKLTRALDMAANGVVKSIEPAGSRRSSTDSTGTLPLAPLEGGEVSICAGCMDRERKRANRKKTKKPEEEERWFKDEAKRILMFNTHEIQEWHEASSSQPTKPQKGKATATSDAESSPIQLPDGTQQIELPTRIACYCRHTSEKLGFQVIFTIKDHRAQVVAQGVSNSIMITDDHKTHTHQPSMQAASTFIPQMGVPDTASFMPQPLNGQLAPQRNAFSTTDLQALQMQYNPVISTTNSAPFVVPQDMSQGTSATMTPNNFSRQGSPSLQGNPAKRRKGGGGMSRIPDQLQMTKIQTDAAGQSANQAWSASVNSPASGSPFRPTSQNGTSRHHHQNSTSWLTNPPTPNNDPMFSATERSLSFGTLPQTRPSYSLPNSAHGSRAASPILGPRTSQGAMPNFTALQNQPALMPNLLEPSVSTPLIHKVIPSEGPKSGGIEVTVLGEGFYNGLQVMFGNCPATTTTWWGEVSLTCLLPAAVRPGMVHVTLKHLPHMIQHFPPTRRPPVYFNYIDRDEEELLRQALDILNQKMNYQPQSVSSFVRQILATSQDANGQGSVMNGLGLSGNVDRQAGNYDLEAKILKFLELIDLVDLDDSPRPSNLNLRGPNGQGILHSAASLGYIRLVAGLLARGANPDLRDHNGHTPMHMAAMNGHALIVRKLRAAKADSELRNLRGFTPADMATTREVHEALLLLSHSRSQSLRYNWQASRASSFSSTVSRREIDSLDMYPDSSVESDDEASATHAISSNFSTPAQPWSRSRRNSVTPTPELISPIENPSSLIAWRESLALQIQQFQQNVSRTFPNLQLPNLPAMPNLPNLPNLPENYQAGFMMRHLSSFVPRSSSSSDDGRHSDSKESESRWWDMLTGAPSPAPPAYEEIYPSQAQQDNELKTESAVRAAADTAADQKCAALYDDPTLATSSLTQRKNKTTNKTLTIRNGEATPEELEKLRAAHAERLKSLKSDFKLYFVWIPILVFVVAMAIWNKAPHAIRVIKETYFFVSGRVQDSPVLCQGIGCVTE